MSKTAEERAYNYASTQKPTKLQVGEIAKHYNNGYNKAMQDFLEKACEWLSEHLFTKVVEDNPSQHYVRSVESMGNFITQTEFLEQFKNYIENESEN